MGQRKTEQQYKKGGLGNTARICRQSRGDFVYSSICVWLEILGDLVVPTGWVPHALFMKAIISGLAVQVVSKVANKAASNLGPNPERTSLTLSPKTG